LNYWQGTNVECCQQKGGISGIVSLGYACATLRREQILNDLQLSSISGMEEGCHAIVSSFCESRTVIQKVFYSWEIPMSARPMECSLSKGVSLRDVRTVFNKAHHNFEIAPKTF
jgi:hypothetical protein